MNNVKQTQLPFLLGNLLALLCAVVILIAFLFMPWFQLEDGDTVTGYRIAADTEGDLVYTQCDCDDDPVMIRACAMPANAGQMNARPAHGASIQDS